MQHVGACLALVRPVGMTDAEAGEFLTVAAAEVAEYPADILAAAARHVRRTVTRPGEIVPALVAHCNSAALIRSFRERRRAEPPTPAPRPPAPPLTQRDVDRLPPYLKRIGLACGALVTDPRGKVRPAPEPGRRRNRKG